MQAERPELRSRPRRAPTSCASSSSPCPTSSRTCPRRPGRGSPSCRTRPTSSWPRRPPPTARSPAAASGRGRGDRLRPDPAGRARSRAPTMSGRRRRRGRPGFRGRSGDRHPGPQDDHRADRDRHRDPAQCGQVGADPQGCAAARTEGDASGEEGRSQEAAAAARKASTAENTTATTRATTAEREVDGQEGRRRTDGHRRRSDGVQRDPHRRLVVGVTPTNPLRAWRSVRAGLRIPGRSATSVGRIERADGRRDRGQARRSWPGSGPWRARWRRARTLRIRTAAGVTSMHSSPRQNSSACSMLMQLRRDQPLQLVAGGGAHVGELLLLGRVDVHVVGAGVLADDHALVDLGAGPDEQRARAPAG